MGYGAILKKYHRRMHRGSPELTSLCSLPLLRSAVDVLTDGLAVVEYVGTDHVAAEHGGADGDARWVFVNTAFADFLGCLPEELLGASLRSTDLSPIDATIRQFLFDVGRSPKTVSVELVTNPRGDSPRWGRLQSAPLSDASGRITGRVVTLRDISRYKRTEEDVRRDERLVGIGLLATGVAHEINNPLGSALLAAETALAVQEMAVPEMANGGDLIACLNNIVASVDRCGRIVRTLLRYSRDEPTERQCCSINDVAKQSIDLTRSYADRCGATVRLERSEQPPLTPMNPLEIEMALVNLIRNAIQASGANPEVLVRTGWNESTVFAAVSDRGAGMTSEQITKIFEPLYTTRSESGGSGLGLAITAGIVRRHQGSVEVLSHPGEGTTITLKLPISADSSGAIDVRANNYGANSGC